MYTGCPQKYVSYFVKVFHMLSHVPACEEGSPARKRYLLVKDLQVLACEEASQAGWCCGHISEVKYWLVITHHQPACEAPSHAST